MENLTIVIKKTEELSPQELISIMQERVKVFVVEQNCPYQEIDQKDENAIHICLKKNGALLAYSRIIPHDDQCHISLGRVLVVKKYRRHALGRKLLTTSLQEIKKRYPDQAIKIQAQSYLEKFYASFGFEAVSAVYLEDNIPHIDMLLKVN
ncbi:MAG TPA: GNAT family N-acetyltransferase [Tetragenococcus sp.]|nr:GNAT family N-acetyltransferase [Tetragenococcus sp.]